MDASIQAAAAAKNDRREIFGWLMYDWANSIFFTTVIGVLLGPYLTALAQNSLGKGGVVYDLGFLGSVVAESLVPFSLGMATLSQVFFLPLLGAIADYTHLKKRMMAFFCYAGVVVSSFFFFITGDSYKIGAILMMVSSVCYAAANVFYNAYLVDLTTEDRRDRISSYGFATGYAGGLIMLIVNMATVYYHEQLGISTSRAVRISMLAASLSWGIFAVITFYLVKSRGATKKVPPGQNIVTIGFFEVFKTLKDFLKLRYTLLFLIGYLFYNDGIQTVINQSSVFIAQELFVSRGLETDQSFLLFIFLIAQISALAGSMAFEYIARFLGAKYTVIICLLIWCGIVIFAFAFFETKTQALVMGACIGLVLGSTQALSRSLFSQMIPAGRESSFFGFYEISEKGTSWIGLLTFTIVIGITGSFRYAILTLIAFFVIGMIILLFTDTDRAIAEAKAVIDPPGS
jgi:UMF1 family MFS transporter